jgi:hypothetical protein
MVVRAARHSHRRAGGMACIRAGKGTAVAEPNPEHLRSLKFSNASIGALRATRPTPPRGVDSGWVVDRSAG